MAAIADDPPAGYYTAVYACVSVLVGMLLVLLIYVLCSKRYRLNWFERTVLEAAQDKEDALKRSLVDTPSTTTSDINDGTSVQCANGSPPPAPLSAVATTEFWVPPSLQRQASVCQSDTPDYSGDESLPGTPNTPLGVKMSPFALQQMVVTGEKFIQPQAPSTSTTSTTSATSGIRPRLSSMHSKLDHTKINAAMYQKPLVKTPSVPEDMRGSLQLALTYDINFGLLVVNLMQARDLVARDISGTADPYAKIRVLPNTVNFRHSRVHKKTLQPVFEEEFAFQIPPSEIGKRTLEVLVYDFDQYSRHQCLGSMQLPFDRIDFSDKVTLWKGISPCDEKDEKAELGDLMFSLGYLHSAERLTVVILKARNLPFFDEGAKNASDTYVKVSLVLGGKRVKKKKTSTQRGTIQPIFNEALNFSVPRDQLQQVSLEFTVYHDAILGPKEPLGRVLISSDSKGEEGAHYRDMINSKTPVARWHCLIDPETRHS